MSTTGTYSRERQLRAHRFGFGLFILSQSVAFLTAYAAQYLFHGFFVSSRLNQWLGALESLLIVVGAFYVKRGVRSTQSGQVSRMIAAFRVAAFLGLVNLALLGYQWGTRVVHPGTRFGESYFLLSGLTGFYTLVAVFILIAISVRAGRVRYAPNDVWDVEASWIFYLFQTVTVLITYVLLYIV